MDGTRTPRRAQAEISQSKVKDYDVQSLAIRGHAMIAGAIGVFMGAGTGFLLVAKFDSGLWVVPICMIGFGVAMTLIPLGIVSGSGRVGAKVYMPSGSTTPHKKEYSYPESLVARGMYEDAVSAFELVVVEEHTGDPTPYLRIARIYRDNLTRYEDSVRWLKRALNESKINAGLAALARREFVELYRTKLEQPEKAAPILARLAHEMAGTADGEWAAKELRSVKEQMIKETDS
ncbi:MAG: hypothetical protein O2992_01335 [Gemmatimonadetes bacterium]|nr:hypothetical protein [Gemmatimonadota bacterium]